MTSPKKYRVILILSLMILAVATFVGVREPFRRAHAEAAQTEALIARGSQIYAENCMSCHGPKGEGHVGMPLNRSDLQGTPETNKAAYEMLLQTIKQGRPGTDETRWVKQPDGKWLSYTAMPAWGRDFMGPLDDQQVDALANFIMQGWDSHSPTALAPNMAIPTDGNNQPIADSYAAALNKDQEATRQANLDAMPAAPGLSDAEQSVAKGLIFDKGCLACHAIGNVGGTVGPDLTQLGSWGVDREFLLEWIRDPQSVVNRMPEYWSKDRLGPEVDTSKPTPLEVPTQMPAIKMTDSELEAIVDYLLHLK